MSLDNMKLVAENEHLHISTGVIEDEHPVREYDVVVINDRKDGPVGAIHYNIYHSENDGKDSWNVETKVILRGAFTHIDDLFEEFPNIDAILDVNGILIPNKLNINSVTPAQDFALRKVPDSNGESHEATQYDDDSLSAVQKDAEYWQEHELVGEKFVHTTNAVMAMMRKLKKDERQIMTTEEAGSLLAVAERGPGGRKKT